MSAITANRYFPKQLQFILLVVLPLLVMLWIFIKAAWVSDDAYITFRTIDNFLNGYGLRWNVVERVQAYTHPLWMWFIMLAVVFTGKYYMTVTVLSLVLSLLSVLLVLRKIPSHVFASFMAMAVLVSSKAFVDYTTSGLENPLSFLLMAIFASILFKGKLTTRNLGWLCFVAALATLNRMDMILLYLPAILISAFKLRKEQGISSWELLKILFIGFLPFILWEIFSIIYYGFPFPNTAYAKLSVDIPLKRMLYQGMKYYYDSLVFDSLTLPFISSACFLGLYYRKGHSIAIAVGIGLYLMYILYIGGDFMSGRFFSVPLFSAVILMIHLPLGKITSTGLGVAAIVVGLLIPHPTLLYDKYYYSEKWQDTGIADERGFYYQCSGLLSVFPEPLEPKCQWVYEGKEYKKENVPLVICGTMGFRGFYGGPGVHIIDTFGLTDPFLGRLPSAPHSRIGHFNRGVPSGYRATILTNQNLLENPRQHKLYNVIYTITREPVFSLERFEEIVKINLGFYDDLKVNPGVYEEPQ